MKFRYLAVALLLSSCGAVYYSPNVNDGVGADGTKVRVVPLTYDTVQVANRAAYVPRSLPSAFFASAGGGGSSLGLDEFPDPAFEAEARPRKMETILPPEAPSRPYRIGVSDELRLATPRTGSTVEELTGLLAKETSRQGYVVQDDGAISIPDVGRVPVAGKTLEEAEDAVFNKLVDAGINPVFSLEVSDFNSQRVSVGGAVKNPTVVPITLNTLILSEALNAAGGVALNDLDYASIRLFRDGQLYQIPIKELYRRASLQNLPLQAGDSLFIDTDYEIDKAAAFFDQQIRLNEAKRSARIQALNELNTVVEQRRAQLDELRENFTDQVALGGVERDYVYLTGEVKKQRRFALPYGHQATLADALYDADGGFETRTGNPKQIYVLRGSSNPAEFSGVTAWNLDATNAGNLILATRMQLRPNDIIFIAEQPITKWNRVITQIGPSLVDSSVAAAVN